ncbi:hypothetical protein [Streptomyces sp. NRRL WC-3742]|nr:hypothetical protein [Streptomyces sp. NRRL WC-3742]
MGGERTGGDEDRVAGGQTQSQRRTAAGPREGLGSGRFRPHLLLADDAAD